MKLSTTEKSSTTPTMITSRASRKRVSLVVCAAFGSWVCCSSIRSGDCLSPMELLLRPSNSRLLWHVSDFSPTASPISISTFRLTLSSFFSWQILRRVRFASPLHKFPNRETRATGMEITDRLGPSDCIIKLGGHLFVCNQRDWVRGRCVSSPQLYSDYWFWRRPPARRPFSRHHNKRMIAFASSPPPPTICHVSTSSA